MKHPVRVRINGLNPFVMLIYVVLIDLSILMVFLLQQLKGVIFLPQPLALALIWIPPAVIILFFILFELGVFLTIRSKRKSTSKKTYEIIEIKKPAAKHSI
jgi:hypothetical protein